MKKLKIGVVGLGMGNWHIKCFNEHPSAEVVALADPNKERLAKCGKENNVTALYEDALQMFKKEKLDVVSIATPNKFHKPLTIAALKAGIHVLCEKPMAMNAKEAAEMVKVSKETGKRLMINFSFRCNPYVWALKKQTETGMLGDIYFTRSIWHRRRGFPGFGGWFTTKELSGGGPLIDLGVHRLDMALWLMNYPEPTWVFGSTYDYLGKQAEKIQKKNYDVEDFAVALIKFKNGATLELEASWAANIHENEQMETRILGSKGGLHQFNRIDSYEMDAMLFTENEGVQLSTTLKAPIPSPKSTCYHFVDCIINNKPHIATGEQGLIVMKILDAIYESAKTGVPVKVK